MKSVIVGEETSCLLQSAFKTRRGESSDWPQVVCSFLMQPRIRNGQEETQKSSGLARAALIGSMLICDLKYIVNGAEYLAENLVWRVSYDVVSLGAETFFKLCFAQHLTLGGLPQKQVAMWPKRIWMRLQIRKERTKTPLLCTQPCSQLT